MIVFWPYRFCGQHFGRGVVGGRDARPPYIAGAVVGADRGKQRQRIFTVGYEIYRMNSRALAQKLGTVGVAGGFPQRVQYGRVVFPAFVVHNRKLGRHPAEQQGAVEPHIWLGARGVRRVVDFHQYDWKIAGYAERPQRLLSAGVPAGGGRPFPHHPRRVE